MKDARPWSRTVAQATLAAVVLAGCAAHPDPEAGRRLEFLSAPITAIDDVDDGVVAVGLEPMARVFVIHPELSPDAAALTAFARSRRGKAEAVHVTVWVRARNAANPPRGLDPVHPDDRWPFVIVRLAATPDPRSSGD